MMIRRLNFAQTLLLSLTSLFVVRSALAADQFPYQAVVVGEQAEVRCGPGQQFYVTSLANMNDQVTVHRHDHGGWYMISPPAGSFSWIDARLVNPLGNNRGLVTISPGSGQRNRAIVRIGSTLSDDHSFFGRELSNGDEVTILGEKVLAGKSGGVRMLKIAPPAQEFRWIKGEFLVPMSRQIQQQLAVDPYQVPPEHRQRQALLLPAETTLVAAEFPAPKMEAPRPDALIETADAKSPVLEMKTALLPSSMTGDVPELVTSPSAAQRQQEFDQLEKLHRNFVDMMALDPSEWELDPIAQSLSELQKSADPHIAHLAAERLKTVAQRQKIAGHYRRFIQVSAETSRRDAQLLAQRADFQTDRLEAPPVFQAPMEGSPEMQSVPVPQPEFPAVGPQISSVPAASVPPGSMLSPAIPSPEGVTPQLNGAGIIQPVQAPPGFPKFILTAPDGRMLAYVEPGAGVSLESWIGKQAGIIGLRSREENYGADLIRAQKIVPVKLSP